MIQDTWFKRYKGTVDPDLCDIILQSYNTAAETGERNSYSVCITAGIKGKDIYILDVWRKRVKFPTLPQFVPEHAKRWDAHHILIEKASSGIALYQSLHRRLGVPIAGRRSPASAPLHKRHHMNEIPLVNRDRPSARK